MVRVLQLPLVAILSFLIGIYVPKLFSTTDSNILLAASSNVPAASENQLEKKYAEALTEIQSLKNQVAELQQPISATTSASSAINSEQNLTINADRAHAAEVKLAEMRAEKFSKWLLDGSKKDTSLNSGMQAQFNAEPVNQEWASHQEKQLSDMFAERKELAGFALKQTSCRTSQCQISIGITGIDQANTIAELFSKLAAEQNFMSVVSVPDVVANMATFYITNSESGFELN